MVMWDNAKITAITISGIFNNKIPDKTNIIDGIIDNEYAINCLCLFQQTIHIISYDNNKTPLIIKYVIKPYLK